MIKIIDGKKYDTDTAECVATKEEMPEDNLSYVVESLYRKTNGEYFLYGEGGPQSRYVRWLSSNSYTSGSEIIPLTEEEAKSWAENLPGETYISIFGDPEE